MKRLLLPLLAALALPTAVNALSYEERLELCALHRANQISYKEVFIKLGFQEPLTKKEGGWRSAGPDMRSSVEDYCNFYGHGP